MDKGISLLIGSGFSKADGMPLIREITERLLSLDPEEIYITSALTFHIVDSNADFGYRPHRADEMFFVYFSKFLHELLKNDFNYEVIFDVLHAYNNGFKYKQEFESYAEDFMKKHKILGTSFEKNTLNWLARYEKSLTDWLFHVFSNPRHQEEVHKSNYPPYDHFAYALGDSLENGLTVDVHSLNHDLLFEHLGSKHDKLWSYYTDGFVLEGSPYYGDLRSRDFPKTYKVKTRFFCSDFHENLRLYKLHGSVDTVIANFAVPPELDLTRIKREFGTGDVYKEVLEEDKHVFQGLYWKPQILTGQTAKAFWYKQPYFRELIEKLKENLARSSVLVVIGYGFGDDQLNSILESEYLVKRGRMIVINKSNLQHRFFTTYNVRFLESSFEDVSYEKWKEIFSES